MTACQSPRPIATASHVDLERFMGDWYVVANIPTFPERDAWNALERYELREDGVIETTFSFNRGGPDGPRREYRPKGFVRDSESQAVWGMQFVWPVKAEYRILFVDPGYQTTVIGRRKRDYLWIMARDPQLEEEILRGLEDFAVEQGYPRERIQRVPHRRP
jgi:apolipoprotein D and lipocalin family protein